MNGVAAFCHIVAGGFDAGSGVRTDDVKLGNSTLLNKGGKRLAGQGVALYLRKDMIGYDVQLRHQLCTTSAGFEGSRSRRKVVMLNVNDKLFRLFSGSKDHHHFIGKTAVSVLSNNFVTFKPLRYGKLFVIYCHGIVPVHIAEKSEK